MHLKRLKSMFNIVVFSMPKGQEFKIEGGGAKAKLAKRFMRVDKIKNPELINDFKDKDLWRFALTIPTNASQRNLVYASFLSDFVKEHPEETCLQYDDFVRQYGFFLRKNELVKNE